MQSLVFKPYYRRREKQQALENMEQTRTQVCKNYVFTLKVCVGHRRVLQVFLCVQVQEAKAAAEKAQQLLENVANRKKNKQLETGGLVIIEAVYGNPKAIKKITNNSEEKKDEYELASQIVDVTLPLNFLVNDSGQLKVRLTYYLFN